MQMTREDAIKLVATSCLGSDDYTESELKIQMTEHPSMQFRLIALSAMLDCIEWYEDQWSGSSEIALEFISTLTRAAADMGRYCDKDETRPHQVVLEELRKLVNELIVK